MQLQQSMAQLQGSGLMPPTGIGMGMGFPLGQLWLGLPGHLKGVEVETPLHVLNQLFTPESVVSSTGLVLG